MLQLTVNATKPSPTVNLYLNNILFPQASNAKYLGFSIDANFSFDQSYKSKPSTNSLQRICASLE